MALESYLKLLDFKEDEDGEEELDMQESTRYRATVARAVYLGFVTGFSVSNHDLNCINSN